ncbi:hypothetical protein NDA07_06965 [Microcoleus vaginatus DQ-U2]|uniref:hypothetical protein n=1 Tax=Microcoleus vaginatus TaxID=119532 RepID=UPI0016885AFB|nr:hypothetical protein [Microcoleus sp. FACHB-DQ6]
MIFNAKATQKNNSQKLADISLNKDKSNQLWNELDETSQAAVSGGLVQTFFAKIKGSDSFRGVPINFDDRGNGGS